jgi:hypothetical protein
MNLDNLGQIQKTHPHLVHKVRQILTAVQNHESLCLTGMPKVGINRLIDLAVKSTHRSEFEIIYDHDHSLTLDQITAKISKRNKKKPQLLVLPFLQSETDEFIQELSGKLQRQDKNKIILLSHISCIQYLSVKQNLQKQTKLYSLIDIVKPLTLIQTKQMIDSKFGDQIKEEKIILRIYELSGGVAGLVKRLCNYFLYYQNLDEIDSVAKYLPVNENLNTIMDEIKILPNDVLIDFGVINLAGEYISQLIEYIIRNKKTISSRVNSLTGNEKLIFDLLLRHINSVVKIDKIDLILRDKEFFSFWGNYRAVSRLRQKISNEFAIKNIKGKGYMLVRKDGN